MKINKKLLKKLVLVTSFVSGQFACANMLSPFTIDTHTLGFDYSENNSMFLGQWKNQIANKLNPIFYSHLGSINSNNGFSSNLLSAKYKLTEKRFIVPVFSDNFSLDQITSKGLYFSFSTENHSLTGTSISQRLIDVSAFKTNTQNSKSYSQLVGQEFYNPSYIVSNGNSAFGVGAVLVQQRFLDDSFGNYIFASSSNFQPFNDKSFINVNRGTGYQMSFTQQLLAKINFAVEYRSKIEMNEFDSFGNSYSEPGDFDIPRQYTFSLSVPFSQGYKLNLSSENIDYSNINTVVHAGYSQSFLRVFNSPIRPLFLLKDLTVYSLGIEQQATKSLSWKAAVVSRQQAPATVQIYNAILEDDTAAFSYRLGFSKLALLGEFNFYASFADKPLLIGGTEFGRLTNTELTRHIEGVASWNFSF